jgi:hypothetical protein
MSMSAHIVSYTAPSITPDPPGWTLAAACQFVDAELFFPEKGGSTREAKLVCAGCDVRQECLQFALDHQERFGIYGGLSERERRRLLPGYGAGRGARRNAARCGTASGYAKHRRLGEQACRPCLDAAAAGWRRRKAEQRARGYR